MRGARGASRGKPSYNGVMRPLWHAFLAGFGWHVGTEAAKDALEAAERALAPDAAPSPDPKSLAVARKARDKADARATRERVAAQKRAEKEIDEELRALKKRVKR